MEQTERTVIESALTMAEFACFTAGPYGMVAAGGIAVGERLFDMFTAPPKPPLSDVVEKVVSAELVGAEIDEGQVHFNTTYRWFCEVYNHYRTVWDDRSSATNAKDSEFADARADLRESLGPQSPFVNFLEALHEVKKEEAKDRAFRVWMMGAGVHLSLLKFRLLLEDVDMAGSLSLVELLETLDSYNSSGQAEYLAKLKVLRDAAAPYNVPCAILDDRLKLITDLEYASNTFSEVGAWYFHDRINGSVQGQENNTGIIYQNEHKGAAADDRAAYIQNITDEWERRSNMLETLNQWRKMYHDFARVSNSGKGAQIDADKYPPLANYGYDQYRYSD